jgi:2-hydroxychromene-2-carboxylate isomerase
VAAIEVTLFSDPGCPWAYSAAPAHTVLRWRYREQLQWRLVTIGLTEDPKRYVEAGYTPARSAAGYTGYRRYGMPFATEPRVRVTATGRACRAIVATKLLAPGREWAVYRALQLGWFTTPMLMDEDAAILIALGHVEGIDPRQILAAIDNPHVGEAYEADRAEARSAQGSPTAAQGKARKTDGPVRYSAPSLVLQAGDRRLEAGGFQPLEAYDVLVVNLQPSIERTEPPSDPLPALEHFGEGLFTQEVAAIMAHNNQQPDRIAAERALIELVADGRASRTAVGDDALWRAS